MNEATLREAVLTCLSAVAPEIEASSIEPDLDLREQIDIDSMDFLNFAIALHDATGVEIPELDYPKLATLDGCVSYLGARLEAQNAEVSMG